MIGRFDLPWARGPRAWAFFRWALFAAGLSLAFYLPYRYATRPPTLPGLYAFLLPLSAILAAAGVALALKPAFPSRLPAFVRAGIAAVAVLWLGAGVVCIPSLVLQIMSAPVIGLLATFQMLLQHVFLAAFVGAFVVIPDTVCAWFGLRVSVAQHELERTGVRSKANV